MPLHAHSVNVMNAFGTLIEDINDPVQFACSLAKLVKSHHLKGIKKEDILKLNELILEYCLEEMKRRASRTLTEAFRGFFHRISGAFK